MSSASGLRLGGMIDGRGNAAASVLMTYSPSFFIRWACS
jgi:hypothetical protein